MKEFDKKRAMGLFTKERVEERVKADKSSNQVLAEWAQSEREHFAKTGEEEGEVKMSNARWAPREDIHAGDGPEEDEPDDDDEDIEVWEPGEGYRIGLEGCREDDLIRRYPPEHYKKQPEGLLREAQSKAQLEWAFPARLIERVDTTPKQCECGSTKAGTPGHSTWCGKYERGGA